MAYDTFLYINPQNGSDSNDGLSESTSLLTYRAAILISDADAVSEKYTVFVLGGELSEEFGVDEGISYYAHRLVFMFGARMRGAGTVGKCAIRHRGSLGGGTYQYHNVDIAGYEKAIAIEISGSGNTKVEFQNCNIDGDCDFEFGYTVKLSDCIFKNSKFDYSGGQFCKYVAFDLIENCTFYDCEGVFFTQTPVAGDRKVSKNIFKNTKLSIIELPLNRDSLVFDNCEVRFCIIDTYYYGTFDTTVAYAAVSDSTELNTKRNLDLGTTDTDYGAGWIYFDTVDFLDETNDNLFLASKDLYTYNSDNNKRHIGANRYVIYTDSSQMTPDTNSTVSGGYATRINSSTSEIVCDAIEFPRAQIIKRAYAIVDIGNGGEIMSSQTEDVNKRIIDVDLSISATKTAAQLDASPEAYQNFEIGIVDETTLEYDEVNQVAKSVKPKFTIKNEGVSTDFGEVKVYQIIVETEDIFTFENYTDYELKQIAGNSQNCKDYTGSGDWIAPNEVNINPNNDVQVQTLIDLYSGEAAGTTEFTIDEIMAMNAASGGALTGVFAETLGVAGISGDDLQTQYARIETTAGTPEKTIHTFNIL